MLRYVHLKKLHIDVIGDLRVFFRLRNHSTLSKLFSVFPICKIYAKSYVFGHFWRRQKTQLKFLLILAE